MPVKVSISRSNTIAARLAEAQVRLHTRINPGLSAAANVLLTASLEIVPRDTEYLAQTGRVTEYPDVAMVTVGYGHKDYFPKERKYSLKAKKYVWRYPYEYAWLAHEEREVEGKTYAGVPYLRGPCNNSRSEMGAALLAAIV